MILHPIHLPLANIEIPEKMNNPFDYEPHPLCALVCEKLQAYLRQREDWREEIDHGKMFGVLIVRKSDTTDGEPSLSRENGNGNLFYLMAYSGQIGGRSDWEDFVPAVFDYLQPDGYFKTHEAEISHINARIKDLESDERMRKAKEVIASLQEERMRTIANYQQKMKEAKEKRDAIRQGGTLSSDEEQALIKESQFMKAELRRLKKSLAQKTTLENEYAAYLEDITRLKQLRKQLSDALQQWLFSQFRMLNPQGECKDLLEIFRDFALAQSRGSSKTACMSSAAYHRSLALKSVPPAGSGECCEPKLLQYAYSHGYEPLQMAMFWWGESPKEEIRHHLQFYPACNGKCKPILYWMLPELNESSESKVLEGHVDEKLDEVRMQGDVQMEKQIEILYEDRELAVICKPAGMLSVPGKDSHRTSVYSIMRKKFPEATGPLIVHRLDMATSGLMVIAKTEFAYHRLQEQFAHHQIQKKYMAIICCNELDELSERTRVMASDERIDRGVISLPLMPDYYDRPRQIVSQEHGKEAVSEYQILGEVGNPEDENISTHHYLRIALFPKTGRTHQLRVHCAHREGLNAPILGDSLYGNEKANRLYLHAESIRFSHPMTGKYIYMERKADF